MSKTALKYDWEVIGYDKQKMYLQNALQQDRLAHAYLLVGPAGTGKTAFAREAARQVLGQPEQIKRSPDYFEIEEKEEIKIADIRALISRFSLTAISQSRRVAVISGIERATNESLNALLKILEEPKGQAIFFLTTQHLGVLPETIISRTQKFFFTTCLPAQIEAALNSTGIDAKKRKLIIDLSGGRIGKAMRLAQNSEYFEKVLDQEDRLKNFLEGDTIARLNAASEIAAEETGEIKNLLGQWLASPLLSSNEFKNNADINIIYKILIGIENALNQLNRNANRKLVLDSLAISL